jgi:hypothetical protein
VDKEILLLRECNFFSLLGDWNRDLHIYRISIVLLTDKIYCSLISNRHYLLKNLEAFVVWHLTLSRHSIFSLYTQGCMYVCLLDEIFFVTYRVL